MNPIVSQIWNKQMPLPNDLQAGDQHNTRAISAQSRCR